MFDFLRDVTIDAPKIELSPAPPDLVAAVETTAQALSEWRTTQLERQGLPVDGDEYTALHAAHYEALRTLAAYELATIEPMITPLRPALDKAQTVTAGFADYRPAPTVLDGWTMAIQDAVMSQADRLTIAGLTMGGFVQGGFIRSWYNEALRGQLQEVGAMISTYIQEGMLEQVDGGQLAQALSEKVITDLATELEK